MICQNAITQPCDIWERPNMPSMIEQANTAALEFRYGDCVELYVDIVKYAWLLMQCQKQPRHKCSENLL